MRRLAITLTALCMSLSFLQGRAQYYELANQMTNLISPALSGSLNYKGFVDISGIAGIGQNSANFIGLSTSQGFTYSTWFFMGAGLGVDVAMANDGERPSASQWNDYGYFGHPSSKTMAMLPIFSDFRFMFGNKGNAVGGFLDLKIGATWLLGNDYLQLGTARLGGGAQFYLRPTLGLRIPVSGSNPHQALNIGVTYQLITSGNNYYWHDGSVTLNGLGATLSFEW